jgi:hypothetical protein
MNDVDLPEISVLVPTRGASERVGSLRRSVESVLCQPGVAPRVLLLVNGADESAIDPALRSMPRLQVIARAEADLPAAYREGMRNVATPFFATLDDDDELVPGALKVRHAALERHPDVTAVVTNGLRRKHGRDEVHVGNGDAIRRDPLRALLDRNWLLPGSWLCRTTPATRGLFDAMPRHLECTYLALRFAMLGMIWIDDPTVIYQVGSPMSASRSRAYVEGQPDALRQILTLDLPTFARRALLPRIAAAHHRAANFALANGDIGRAWHWHLATLREPSGWRYLPFARHLLRATLQRRS